MHHLVSICVQIPSNVNDNDALRSEEERPKKRYQRIWSETVNIFTELDGQFLCGVWACECVVKCCTFNYFVYREAYNAVCERLAHALRVTA